MTEETKLSEGEGLPTCPRCNGPALTVQRNGDRYVTGCSKCNIVTLDYASPEDSKKEWTRWANFMRKK